MPRRPSDAPVCGELLLRLRMFSKSHLWLAAKPQRAGCLTPVPWITEAGEIENHVYGVDPGNRDCVALHASDSDLIENRTAPTSGPRIDRQALAGAPCYECAVATWPDQSQ